ncbi:hypothetical protein LTR62_007686 [Meristemomyces frigidus]|uniref:Mitochondrial import inner membrane translocase subunit TIM50 n=1 Tax=Meristemomyces frigidus TaxID=1508187 RepID=A0AAN7TAA2_9PEZI|nr:hypothetical protein LTR62_007686 [Meristemomyces frigidus]
MEGLVGEMAKTSLGRKKRPKKRKGEGGKDETGEEEAEVLFKGRIDPKTIPPATSTTTATSECEKAVTTRRVPSAPPPYRLPRLRKVDQLPSATTNTNTNTINQKDQPVSSRLRSTKKSQIPEAGPQKHARSNKQAPGPLPAKYGSFNPVLFNPSHHTSAGNAQRQPKVKLEPWQWGYQAQPPWFPQNQQYLAPAQAAAVPGPARHVWEHQQPSQPYVRQSGAVAAATAAFGGLPIAGNQQWFPQGPLPFAPAQATAAPFPAPIPWAPQQQFFPAPQQQQRQPQAPAVPSPSPLASGPPPANRPQPTATYLAQARRLITLHPTGPRKLLVILDLNGTLLHRKGHHKKTFEPRPRVVEFIHYLFTNHKVMVWSSARPANVEAMCAYLFTPQQRSELVAVWTRDNLRLSFADYTDKVQVYKRLSWVWEDEEIAYKCAVDEECGEMWGQGNTVLIDDSEVKAATEPFNLVKVEEFLGGESEGFRDMLGQVAGYLEALKGMEDVSNGIWYDSSR